MTAARQPPAAGTSEPPAAGAGVAAAVAYAGADAVRYWLTRLPAARAGVLDRMERAARQLGRDTPAPPFPAPPTMARDLDAVRFACADAAATMRWAAELGAARTVPPAPAQLSHPAQIALLTQLSWLPERVAAAARRRQPDELPRALESLAGAWLDCRESCPALPFGGRDAPADGAGTSARLWLADATRAALAAGLELVGVIAAIPGSEYL
jgi:DALR anticodon binding domain